MDTKIINVLITSFGGLGLPKVLSIPTAASTTIDAFETRLSRYLPQVTNRLVLTTTSRRELSGFSSSPISSLLSDSDDTFLPLRLSTELCGGKGGFGSQLRAAGGRMSSRRKKNQGDSNSSNRNLDGRRLRTVAEAKALAEYLALKPDMEKKEKETRRKRWEQVIELAERREVDARTETSARVNTQWSMDKEESEEKTREAVVQAIRSETYHDKLKANFATRFERGFHKVSSDDEGPPFENTIEEAEGARNLMLDSRAYYGFDDVDDDDHEENNIKNK